MTRREVLMALAAPLAVAQDPEAPAFRAQTVNVAVNVAVLDADKAVAGLTAGDFVVRDGGDARAIVSFTREELPLDIVLVCRSVMVGRAWPPDGSEIAHYYLERGSMGMAARLTAAATDAVRPARAADRVAMVIYGRDPRVVLNFTNQQKEIASAIRRIGTAEEVDENLVITSEALAIEYAVRMFEDLEKRDPEARVNRRRVVVMISNPWGVGAKYADEPLVRRLWEQNVVFSAIKDSEPGKETGSLLPLFREYNPGHIARATGGDYIPELDPRNRPDLLGLARQRYTLWFNQPADVKPGEVRSISVELAGAAARRTPGAKIRAREGYVTR